jgi:hypothetical protein
MKMNNRAFYEAFDKDILNTADLEKKHEELSSLKNRYTSITKIFTP